MLTTSCYICVLAKSAGDKIREWNSVERGKRRRKGDEEVEKEKWSAKIGEEKRGKIKGRRMSYPHL